MGRERPEGGGGGQGDVAALAVHQLDHSWHWQSCFEVGIELALGCPPPYLFCHRQQLEDLMDDLAASPRSHFSSHQLQIV